MPQTLNTSIARGRHCYRQELISRGGPRPARSHRAATEVVAWPGRSPARQSAAMPDRHGGLRRSAITLWLV